MHARTCTVCFLSFGEKRGGDRAKLSLATHWSDVALPGTIRTVKNSYMNRYSVRDETDRKLL
jgi:rubredoxin